MILYLQQYNIFGHFSQWEFDLHCPEQTFGNNLQNAKKPPNLKKLTECIAELFLQGKQNI